MNKNKKIPFVGLHIAWRALFLMPSDILMSMDFVMRTGEALALANHRNMNGFAPVSPLAEDEGRRKGIQPSLALRHTSCPPSTSGERIGLRKMLSSLRRWPRRRHPGATVEDEEASKKAVRTS